MGGSTYSHDDYTARVKTRAATGTPTFAYDAAIKSGKAAREIHASLNPYGVTMRECRDSKEHPVSIPIALCNDLTGSMLSVPITLQKEEPRLMGLFLKDRADGKTYLGLGYPAVMIAGVDDYFAIGAKGAIQVGQFESGLEIDDNLTNLWLTGAGGGNYGESYDLFLYFLARHTVHDHWEKRKKKGYAFIICDEPLFETVSHKAVKEVIGDGLQNGIPSSKIVKEVQSRYNLFCIIPNQTSHYRDLDLREGWEKAIGAQNVLMLQDPTQICELIVSTVAMCEGTVTLGELTDDGVATGAVGTALALLSASTGVTKHSAEALPPVPGTRGKTKRL